ncbi:hypothetical protein K439DRAFT_1568629 [Ramaria rubella]|nr:hypothetical protein K439DRAFT_1568629 [Ramaria rubella]
MYLQQCHSVYIASHLSHTRLTTMEALEYLHMSECSIAASAPGVFFPCAPCRPSLAVSLELLELTHQLFFHVAPNITAWSATIDSILKMRGYCCGVRASLRRCFGNTVQWYSMLVNQAQEYIEKQIHRCPSIAQGEVAAEMNAHARVLCGANSHSQGSQDSPSPAGTSSPLSSSCSSPVYA